MDAVEMERYFEENAVDGELSPEKTEELLQAALNAGGGDVDAAATGDTASGDAPGPEEAAKDEAPPPEETKEPEPEAAAEPEAEPVIVARDGKNTIPYSELADAREAAQNERSRREALERELAELKARLEPGEENADGGETPDAGNDDAAAKLREDWPEVAAAVDGIVGKQRERIEQLEEQLARMQPTTEQLAAERMQQEHYGRIAAAHPDVQDIVASRAFADWQAAQPGFMRQIFEHVINQGTTEQVIELLDGFKQANPSWGSPGPDQTAKQDAAASDNAARQAAVKAAREKAESRQAPKSLSDIPGGEAAPTDSAEAFMQKSPEAQLAAMMDMPADKREALMRRLT